MYDEYVRYAKVLQGWFVAFGIGAIVLFVSKPAAFANLPDRHRFLIPVFLLLAVGLQVVLAVLNKYFNFHSHQKGADYSGWSNNPNWIFFDVTLDVISIAFLVTACVLFMRTGFSGAHAAEVTQTKYDVLRVVDGDTFEIEYDGRKQLVRLALVDAPEVNTQEGEAAKASLMNLINGQEIRIRWTDPKGRKRDNFGRLLCSIKNEDGDVEEQLVERGHAEWSLP